MNNALENLVDFCKCHISIYIYGAGKVGKDIVVFLEKNKKKLMVFV